jgi:hypothetical protein
MSGAGATRGLPAPLLGFFRSRPFSAALVTTGILLIATNYLWVRLAGWAGYLGALTLLVLLMGLVLLARRDEIEGIVVPPISLLVYLGWATISIVWSAYQWVTAGGLAYLYAVTAVALFIAFTRDTIQIVRSMGDAIRWVLALSLGIELLSGLIIDIPIPYLNVGGRLAELGPISGILQTRNQLGIVAIIGAISFATELRTRSVNRLTGIISLTMAGLCIVLTRSPVIVITAGVVFVAAAVLYGVRRVRPERRQGWQFVVLGVVVLGLAVAWFTRGWLISMTNSGGQLDYRLRVWSKMLEFLGGSWLQGWGWTGRWHPDVAPYSAITTSADHPPGSALNAYLDVLFQLGWVGLVIFVGMLGLAFVRSWLLAGRRRSIIYAWPALVLVALILVSLMESAILVEFGWLVFVICCVKASQELSWRTALSRVPTTAP